MKKFFALLLVVALLAVAGSAFADEPKDAVSHGSPQNPPSNNPQQNNEEKQGAEAAKETVIYVPAPKSTTETVTVINVDYAVMVTAQSLTGKVSDNQAKVQEKANDILGALKDLLGALLENVTSVAVKTNTNITVITSSSYTEGDNAGNLKKAAAKLKSKTGSDTTRAIGVVPPFAPKESGLQPVDLPAFDKAYYGRRPGLFMGARGKKGASAAFLAAAEDDNNEAVFLDSTGTQVEVVPDGTGEAEAGKLTAVVYVEAGEEYEPIITTEVAAEGDDFDTAVGAEKGVEVEVTIDEYEKKTVMASDTFSNYVPEEVLAAVQEKSGKELKTLPDDACGGSWNFGDSAKSYKAKVQDGDDVSFDLVSVLILPELKIAENGSYIFGVSFDVPSTLKKLADTDKFLFYPTDALADGAERKADVYTEKATVVTPANVLANPRMQAYVVFTVDDNGVTSSGFNAAAGATLKPSFAVKEDKTPTPSAPGNNGEDEDGESTGPGDASGGCTAGFSALALAVLGSFVFTRKK